MLGWAITFFIIAIIAAVFGFGGIAGAATGIAQFLFFLFVVLLVISLVAGALRGKAPRVQRTTYTLNNQGDYYENVEIT